MAYPDEACPVCGSRAIDYDPKPAGLWTVPFTCKDCFSVWLVKLQAIGLTVLERGRRAAPAPKG